MPTEQHTERTQQQPHPNADPSCSCCPTRSCCLLHRHSRFGRSPHVTRHATTGMFCTSSNPHNPLHQLIHHRTMAWKPTALGIKSKQRQSGTPAEDSNCCRSPPPPTHPNTHQSIQATTPDAISHLAAWVHQNMMSLQCCEQNSNCTGGCPASTVLQSSLYCSHLRSMQDRPLGSKHCIDMDSLLPSALNGRRTS